MNPSLIGFPLMILALISAVLNFAGFSEITNGSWWQLSLCALTSVGVFVALYAFWKAAFDVVPTLHSRQSRALGWAISCIGVATVLAISAYWNVVALAGSEVDKLILQDRSVLADTSLNRAIAEGGKFKGLENQLTAFSSSIENLADAEESSGAVSGSAGAGTVSKLLRQIAGKIQSAAGFAESASDTLNSTVKRGQACLADLRRSSEAGTAEENRASQATASVDCVNEVIAALGNQSAAAQIAQSMRSLASGVVIPASVKSKKQKASVANILAGVQKQADAVADTAESLKPAALQSVSNSRPNAMLGVLIYWRSIIPAIATAIAIDLLPLILLLFLVLRTRDMERRGKPVSTVTVAEIVAAHQELKQLDRMRGLPLPLETKR